MRKKAILITGAAGEIGDALIKSLVEKDAYQLITLDVRPLPAENAGLVTHIQGDLLDQALLARLVSEYEFSYDLSPGGVALDAGGIHPRGGAQSQC